MKKKTLTDKKLCVCALDSGGSKTIAAICDCQGQVLAWKLGLGTANNHSLEQVTAILLPLLEQSLQQAERTRADVLAVNVCLGGLNDDIVRTVIQDFFPASLINVVRESSGAAIFAGAHFWGFDIALMAGTGTVAVGINSAGDERCVGGWGPLIHDLGSGYAVGQQALRSVAEALDYQEAVTQLLPRLCQHEFLARFLPELPLWSMEPLSYAWRQKIKNGLKSALPYLERRQVAQFFPVVYSCAVQGDLIAIELIAVACRDLVKMLAGLARELSLSAPRINPIGGIFSAGEFMHQAFRGELAKSLPLARIVRCDFQQILGSLLIALELAGLTPNQNLVEQLRQKRQFNH